MNINYEMETIVANATPFGTGGIGIVRISGAKAFDIINKIFSVKNIQAGKIHHGWILKNGKKIDEVIVLPFVAPQSYTGEDVIEIQGHGGIHIQKTILNLVLENGARLAEKGEFTKRAFLNHKIDLSQAEAVLDLIHAKTDKFAVESVENLSGKLSKEIKNIKNEIFNLLSQITAAIDFPEDVKEPEYEYLQEKLNEIIKKTEYILSFSDSSNVFRQGLKIAIVGQPNSGKSSLFNKLLNLERAIVTDIAGTTRDVIQESLDIEGIPVTLIDTAGIRNDKNINKVEAIGIDYTKKCAKDADIILFLYDLSCGYTQKDKEIFELIKNKNYIKVATKSDLTSDIDKSAINISLLTGLNIDKLKQKITETILNQNNLNIDFITNQRQQDCLRKSLNSLKQALTEVQQREIQDLISIDVKSALMFISEISGEIITDDILNNIFDNFCIGK